MKPGVGYLLAGVALVAGGVGLTMAATNTVFYGAVIVGVYYIGRGIYTIIRTPAALPPDDPNV